MSQPPGNRQHHFSKQHLQSQHAAGHPDITYAPLPQSFIPGCNGYSSYLLFPTDPVYGTPQHQTYLASQDTHLQQPPLIMPRVPQWPSMLTSQSTYQPPIFPSAPPPGMTASATPVSAALTQSCTSFVPRRVVTDNQRQLICQYHKDNPDKKQTEIADMFELHRSTVSKILREKEKYLYQNNGNPSSIKKSKSKSPDIELTLSNWAKNCQKEGSPLSDDVIRKKARLFLQASGDLDSCPEINSTSWLDSFKKKNSLTSTDLRKASIVNETEGTSNSPSNVHTQGAVSPGSSGEEVLQVTATVEIKDREKSPKIGILDMPSSLRKLTGYSTSPHGSLGAIAPEHMSNSTLNLPTADPSLTTLSPEDVAQKLELVAIFFSQNANFLLEPQDFMTIGKLIERLRSNHDPEI